MRERRITNTKKFWMVTLIVVSLPILLPLWAVALVLYFAYWMALYFLIWTVWIPRGKDVLFVYSASPIWQDYMLTTILPLVKERAMVLNWSERSKWSRWSFRVQVFRCFGGSHEFNPLVIIFRPFHRAQKFRFLSAFKDWKQGNQGSVEYLREKLALAVSSDGN